ncbi:tellurite resistance TerB family protein [Leptolyngbya sp. BC1307]|uniref:tellurite resistance TerB family protein n=1 Tax=Leptolyngbya sp. BC1307 TaxID=2029589 RepID=UPI000EFC2A35|nr:tellurite resistance TerB family protein [Leptolyngbya sp. BC1307]
MGVFNQVFGRVSDVKLAMNSAEALAAICLVAIAADGYLSKSEEAEMTLRLSRMRLFQDSTESLEHIQDSLVSRLKKYGPQALIESARAVLPPSLAPTAFTIAVDLVFADGIVSAEERAFIDDLRHILVIPDDLALKIVEVMTIKNQG